MSADICPKCANQSVRADECNYCGWSAFDENDLRELREERDQLQTRLAAVEREKEQLETSLDMHRITHETMQKQIDYLERQLDLLRKSIAEAPVVYAHDDDPPIWGTVWTLKPASQLGVKVHHRARLVQIEKLDG